MREWMEAMRQKRNLSIGQAARLCGLSARLLELLECTDTHTLPSFALRIARAYGMSPEQCMDIGQALPQSINDPDNPYAVSVKVPNTECDPLFYLKLTQKEGLKYGTHRQDAKSKASKAAVGNGQGRGQCRGGA